MPRRRDDRFDDDHLGDTGPVRYERPQRAETDDVLGLGATTDGDADARGLFESPSDVVHFGQNLLTATARGFATFGENVVEHVGAGLKQVVDEAIGSGGQSGDDDAGGNDGDGDSDGSSGGAGDGDGGDGGDGGRALHGSGVVQVEVDLDGADDLVFVADDAAVDLDDVGDLDDGLLDD